MVEEKIIETYFLKNELNMQDIVDDYYNYIRTIIKNFPNLSIEDEEEILSDVFFIVWKNKNVLEKESRLSPYIARITKNVIYKKYKEINSKFLYDEFDEDFQDNFNIEELLEEKELNDCIIKNLKAVGEEEYLIFSKFYFEDKKIKDISKELGISVSSAKTKLHRTRKKVKEFLKIGGFY